MQTNLKWFLMGVIVTILGMTTLSAKSIDGYGWSAQDVSRVIYLLEQIESHTRRR